ncbi:protein of unknown function [Legionella fallonii LLAP-10]|uniref:Uncharacterized protein n=1 Tax=Legionella fallonii LLAP-10 TaxID=1212491 RepID=A0A098G9S4_9GAMM|nr:protein of unknown function [Legionella fallonii LLAP-10]
MKACIAAHDNNIQQSIFSVVFSDYLKEGIEHDRTISSNRPISSKKLTSLGGYEFIDSLLQSGRAQLNICSQ